MLLEIIVLRSYLQQSVGFDFLSRKNLRMSAISDYYHCFEVLIPTKTIILQFPLIWKQFCTSETEIVDQSWTNSGATFHLSSQLS